MKKIPFIDLQAQQARIRGDIDARIRAVLDHGQYIMGPEVAEFEGKLAAFAGARHAIGVSSGTDALLIAVMALGIGRGDAVFVPAFTFPATAEAIVLVGATPVFVDVDERTANLDPSDLERRVAAVQRDGALRPRLVMPVDLYGLPADYKAIGAIAKRHGMKVLADAAQSFGGEQHGRKVGALADITATSFFPAKPLGCYGDGGAVFTDSDELAATMKSIRVHGQGTGKYDIVRLGVNGRLDTLQAAILLPKLAIFADELDKRQRVAEQYARRLRGIVELQDIPAGSRSAGAQYTIYLKDRDGVAAKLRDFGIPTAVYYPRPMHAQPAYSAYAPRGGLPGSEALSGRVLSLPMHPYLAEDAIETICAAIRDAVAA